MNIYNYRHIFARWIQLGVGGAMQIWSPNNIVKLLWDYCQLIIEDRKKILIRAVVTFQNSIYLS
jgi:hypothetical protein